MANINESDDSKFIRKIPSLAKRGKNERGFISLFYFDMANINESDDRKFIKKIPSLAKRERGDLVVS